MKKMPKAPKKPKRTAPLSSWEKYDKKVQEHKKKIASIEAGKRKKESLIKKHS